MTSTHPFIIRGQSGHLVVPMVAIPAVAIGAFTYYGSRLPEFCAQNGVIVISAAFLLALVLLLVALFRKSRYVRVDSDQLEYRSWLTSRTIALSRITAVSFETEVSANSDQISTTHYLTLWEGGASFVRFDTMLWPTEGLQALLGMLRVRVPQVRFDRAVETYLGPNQKRTVG